MTQLNIEIKAKSNNQNFVREVLKSLNAKFIGVDNQLDTYFKSKLRKIEAQGRKYRELSGPL